MGASDESSVPHLRERVELWREQVGATAGLLGVSAGPDDYDLTMLVGGTSSMIRLVGAEEASPDSLRDIATELAAVRDRQLDELGQGLVVNAIVICDSDAVSRESYRVCESLGVELICFNDTYDRPRLAQIVTVQADVLPSGHPAVHESHQSDAEMQAEIERTLAEDDDPGELGGADEELFTGDDFDNDYSGEFDGNYDQALNGEFYEAGGVPQWWSWNEEHPYELRLFWQEDPDFVMPPITLQGLSGVALGERKRQLARAYFGFNPDLEGVPCPLMLQDYERVFFIFSGSSLLEYRKPPRPPSQPRRGVRVGAISRITSGTYLSMSTRVGSSTAAPASTEEVITPVDDGDIIITSRRVAFVGERLHRDWRYDQMVSSRVESLRFEGLPPTNGVMMSTSNRSKVSGYYLDPDLVSTLKFMIELARCESHLDRQALVRSLA